MDNKRTGTDRRSGFDRRVGDSAAYHGVERRRIRYRRIDKDRGKND